LEGKKIKWLFVESFPFEAKSWQAVEGLNHLKVLWIDCGNHEKIGFLYV